MNAILRALDSNGNEFFYTGRAGEGWVSRSRNEAFPFTLEGGRRKAKMFNANTAIHGLLFIAVSSEVLAA